MTFAISQDISNELSVWWNMDEGSGATVNDPKWTNGVSGKALSRESVVPVNGTWSLSQSLPVGNYSVCLWTTNRSVF